MNRINAITVRPELVEGPLQTVKLAQLQMRFDKLRLNGIR
jgi:hypothetical protein